MIFIFFIICYFKNGNLCSMYPSIITSSSFITTSSTSLKSIIISLLISIALIFATVLVIGEYSISSLISEIRVNLQRQNGHSLFNNLGKQLLHNLCEQGNILKSFSSLYSRHMPQFGFILLISIK